MNSIDNKLSVPKDMLFASASGLDPHISPEAALMQVERIARARNFKISQKEELLKDIKDMTEAPQFLFLGEPRINVLVLNLRLDKIGK
jgi:K+-transporting ATPase ATPase C chain